MRTENWKTIVGDTARLVGEVVAMTWAVLVVLAITGAICQVLCG